MNLIFAKLIDQLNSSVFVLLGVLFSVAWGLFKLGELIQRFRHHDDKIGKLENLSDKIVRLETKVDLIYENTNPRKPVASYSPMALTPLGKQIVESINAKQIFQKYVAQLVEQVGNQGNAYDIQMTALKVAKEKILSLLNDEELLKIKQEAYNRGMIVEDVLSIFGLFLRDHILQQKGIPISDVDKHTPS